MHATLLAEDAVIAGVVSTNLRDMPKKSEPATFGEYLDRLMAENGFSSPADLARATGTSESTISRWRAGVTKNITLDQLRAVAPHLGVRLGDLLIRAGLATPAELGTVGAPPPPRVPLPPELQQVVSLLLSPKYTDTAKRTLLAAIARTVGMWQELTDPPREPQMRRRNSAKT